jgi:hypothetical protein
MESICGPVHDRRAARWLGRSDRACRALAGFGRLRTRRRRNCNSDERLTAVSGNYLGSCLRCFDPPIAAWSIVDSGNIGEGPAFNASAARGTGCPPALAGAVEMG